MIKLFQELLHGRVVLAHHSCQIQKIDDAYSSANFLVCHHILLIFLCRQAATNVIPQLAH